MNLDKNWIVLLIGGASGTGKSSIAYEVAHHYGINVLELDDIIVTMETSTRKEQILNNYFAREGGSLQCYRSEISVTYNKKLFDACQALGIPMIDSKPWDTALT